MFAALRQSGRLVPAVTSHFADGAALEPLRDQRVIHHVRV